MGQSRLEGTSGTLLSNLLLKLGQLQLRPGYFELYVAQSWKCFRIRFLWTSPVFSDFVQWASSADLTLVWLCASCTGGNIKIVAEHVFKRRTEAYISWARMSFSQNCMGSSVLESTELLTFLLAPASVHKGEMWMLWSLLRKQEKEENGRE